MSILLALLSRTWPFLLTGALGLGGGIWVTHTLDGTRYSALQATYAKYQADVAQANATAQQAAREALQKQIDARLTTEANNAKIIDQLTQERDHVAADRDFARRLLAAAQAKPATGRGAVPTADHQPGTADPPEASGDRSLAADIGDAAGECRDAIQGWASLQAQLIPQLRSPP